MWAMSQRRSLRLLLARDVSEPCHRRIPHRLPLATSITVILRKDPPHSEKREQRTVD
jgi:hypothetical protein